MPCVSEARLFRSRSSTSSARSPAKPSGKMEVIALSGRCRAASLGRPTNAFGGIAAIWFAPRSSIESASRPAKTDGGRSVRRFDSR